MGSSGAGFTVGASTGAVIEIKGGGTAAATDAGIAALIQAEAPIYQRSGMLVRPALVRARALSGKRIEVPGLAPITVAYLQRALANVAHWQHYDARRKRQVPCDPPAAVAAQMLSMTGEWPFPVLTATIATPTMRADGTLITAPGFDEATGLFLLDPPEMPPMPASPTQADAAAALAMLRALVREFPFVDGPGSASEAVALSMLLTPVLRPACGDAVPMHSASAPEIGSGKSYLADIAATIATGVECAVTPASRSTEEVEKNLTSLLIEGASIVAIDNINGSFRSNVISQAVERPILRPRRLGENSTVQIPNAVTVFANGNNIRLGGDLRRRNITAFLDPNMERPYERTFTGDPVAAVRKDRGRYVAACLTVARAYVLAGRPNPPRPLASFAEWSSLIAGALIWLGAGNPMDTMVAGGTEDEDREAFLAVLEAWPSGQGDYTASEMVARARATDPQTGEPLLPDWLDAIRPLARDRRGQLSPETLGIWLRDNRGRTTKEWKLERVGTAKKPRWGRSVLNGTGGRGGISNPHTGSVSDKKGDGEEIPPPPPSPDGCSDPAEAPAKNGDAGRVAW